MKKLIAGAIIIANLMSLSAHAEWEFEEKVLEKRMYVALDENDIIWVYYRTGTGQDMWTHMVKNYYLDGTPLEKDLISSNSYGRDPIIKKGSYCNQCEDYVLEREAGKMIVWNLEGEKVVTINEPRVVDAVSRFESGTYLVRGSGGCWACDMNGENIFSKKYDAVYRIDNNEFLVNEDGTGKILTAKGIIGEALNTDVKISINGVEIPCYSVYGYAAVKAEDLRDFGFDVIWDGEDRMLRIYRNPNYHLITAGGFAQYGEPGTHYADIYGSDINVEYDGRRLDSYCIDGETLIKIEDLESDVITFRYDDSVRTLYMDINGLERR